MQLQVVTQTSRERGHLEGTVILMRSSDRTLQPGAGALVLGVGGDTLLGLGQLLESQLYSRPMALDLLWQASALQTQVALCNCRWSPDVLTPHGSGPSLAGKLPAKADGPAQL